MQPLTEALVRRWLRWLPGQAYPVRYGTERGSAFALSLAWPFAEARARAGDPALREAIATKAAAWFSADMIYPGQRLGALGRRLPVTRADRGRADGPDPARRQTRPLADRVPAGHRSGPSGQPVHDHGDEQGGTDGGDAAADPARPGDLLDGLNASRAWCWRRIAGYLPPGDPRVEPALGAARQHAKAALPYVLGSGYQAEHWLASYAVLMLT